MRKHDVRVLKVKVLWPGDDVPNPSTRVLHVALASRNKVNVAVKYGLASSLTGVHADIETNHSLLRFHYFAAEFVEESIAGKNLGL